MTTDVTKQAKVTRGAATTTVACDRRVVCAARPVLQSARRSLALGVVRWGSRVGDSAGPEEARRRPSLTTSQWRYSTAVGSRHLQSTCSCSRPVVDILLAKKPNCQVANCQIAKFRARRVSSYSIFSTSSLRHFLLVGTPLRASSVGSPNDDATPCCRRRTSPVRSS